MLRFISSLRYWFAVKVNFYQIYRLIVQLFSSWNEFNTWESTEGGRVLFVTPDLSNLVAIAVKSRCFCQPDGISITLLEEDVYYTENSICSSLFATKVHEKYVYQRKMSFLYLLLLMCGDVKKCPGSTESNIQDFFSRKGSTFHQNIQGLFHNIAKLSFFLHTHKNTLIFSLNETHIDNSTPTQPGFELTFQSCILKNYKVKANSF